MGLSKHMEREPTAKCMETPGSLLILGVPVDQDSTQEDVKRDLITQVNEINELPLRNDIYGAIDRYFSKWADNERAETLATPDLGYHFYHTQGELATDQLQHLWFNFIEN